MNETLIIAQLQRIAEATERIAVAMESRPAERAAADQAWGNVLRNYQWDRAPLDANRMQATYVPALPPANPTGSAQFNGPLPDPKATPGQINPDVTDDTIATTIAVPGWTAKIRPPTAYTDPLKIQKMREYGIGDKDPKDYELDHLVPLCVGGHPTSELNLWPQPRVGILGARTKDLTEVMAQHAILHGIMSLDSVRTSFQRNWTELHVRLFANTKLQQVMMAIPPPEDEP